MSRIDGRKATELRPVKIVRNFTSTPAGSVLIEMGRTKVLCTATVKAGIPAFLEGTGQGWVTAEYNMLPASTPERKSHWQGTRPEGRTMEIRRMIGRSLRAVVELDALGESTIWIDCDVLEADGGTRTASITGGFVAMVDALRSLRDMGYFRKLPLKDCVASISVGIVEGKMLLDLCYEEDSSADVDLNLVMTDRGEIVEIQGTGEMRAFRTDELDRLIRLGWRGIKQLIGYQRRALRLR